MEYKYLKKMKVKLEEEKTLGEIKEEIVMKVNQMAKIKVK